LAKTKKYLSPAVVLKLGRDAGPQGYQTTTELADFREPPNGCQNSSPVVDGKLVFGVVTATRCALLCCSLETGKTLWRQDMPAGTWSSPLLADGKVFLLCGDGTLLMFRLNGEAYQELARAKVCGDTRASPALSDGHLFVRDGSSLRCLRVGQQ
jgi:outer membrane protein assembly factor BamB